MKISEKYQKATWQTCHILIDGLKDLDSSITVEEIVSFLEKRKKILNDKSEEYLTEIRDIYLNKYFKFRQEDAVFLIHFEKIYKSEGIYGERIVFDGRVVYNFFDDISATTKTSEEMNNYIKCDDQKEITPEDFSIYDQIFRLYNIKILT